MLNDGTHDKQVPVSTRPRLVLADDDPLVRSALGIQLEHTFDCVGAASDTDQAIALVAEHKPDIAILDVNMPGGGADRAVPEIRTSSPHTAIVILSSDENSEQVIRLISSGAISYLRKGDDTKELITKLTASLAAHQNLASRETVPPAG